MQLTNSKARALSAICADIAQVLFGALVATVVIPLDTSKLLVVVLELVLSFLFWALSLVFAQRGKL